MLKELPVLACPGLLTCMQDARYSQLRSSAYALAHKVVEHQEALELSREQLETLSNTISERSASEKNPALQSDIRKLVDILCIQTKAGA